jgi:hypothetical protein
MKDCPVNKPSCPCEFTKELICDYPYSQDMSLEECQNLTIAMRVVGDLYQNCPENTEIAS